MNHLNSTLTTSFFFNDTATPEIYTLSLHDALPISRAILGGTGPADDSPHPPDLRFDLDFEKCKRPRVAVRDVDRPDRLETASGPGAHPLRRRPSHPSASVLRSLAAASPPAGSFRRCWLGPQGFAAQRFDPLCHDQSRLRSGGSRPGDPEPFPLRAIFPGEAAVLQSRIG